MGLRAWTAGGRKRLNTLYGNGSPDCRGQDRCVTMKSPAVLSWVGDTHFKHLLMGLGALTAEGRKRLNTLNGIGSLECRGQAGCV